MWRFGAIFGVDPAYTHVKIGVGAEKLVVFISAFKFIQRLVLGIVDFNPFDFIFNCRLFGFVLLHRFEYEGQVVQTLSKVQFAALAPLWRLLLFFFKLIV